MDQARARQSVVNEGAYGAGPQEADVTAFEPVDAWLLPVGPQGAHLVVRVDEAVGQTHEDEPALVGDPGGEGERRDHAMARGDRRGRSGESGPSAW